MRAIIIGAAILLAAVSVNAQFVVDVQFSTNKGDMVSVPIKPNGTGVKDYDKNLEQPKTFDHDGKPAEPEQIGIGTYVVVTNLTQTEDGIINVGVVAEKSTVISWQEVKVGDTTVKMPVLRSQRAQVAKLRVHRDAWVPLGGISGLEPILVRVRKGE